MTPERSSRRRAVCLSAAVFMTVWAAKLVTIGAYGSDLPLWDQWAKEGELFYAPWFERGEFWQNVFVPHNEHRIAPTLALNWGLLRLGGDQWDARVQCAASAALHALLAAGFAWFGLRTLSRRWAAVLGFFVAATVAPPIAWENVLGGFQSQFYFLALFSLLAIAGLLGSHVSSWRWWGGLGCAAIAIVSMGSGFLVAAPILLIALLRWLELRVRAAQPRSEVSARPAVGPYPSNQDTLAALLAGGVILTAGLFLRTPTPWHEALHAHSPLALATYFVRCLAWPLYDAPWLAALLWPPMIMLAWRRGRQVCRRPTRIDKRGVSSPCGSTRDGNVVADDLIIAAALWVLVQAAAVSYSRSGGSAEPAPRYGDIFALGLLLNGIVAARLASTGVTASRRLRIGTAAWFVAATAALAIAATAVFRVDLPRKRIEFAASEAAVRRFLLTDDAVTLEKEPVLPFPIADWLTRMLRNPTLRRLMPASVREPLPVQGIQAPAGRAPQLPHRATRALAEPGEWRSAILPAGRGYWKIETAGDIGAAGVSLRVMAADGRELGEIKPTKPAGNAWRAAYVRAPREPARLVATIDAPNRWLAFSEPIVMSTLSYHSWRLCKDAEWLLAMGLGLLIASAIATAGAKVARKDPTTAGSIRGPVERP